MCVTICGRFRPDEGAVAGYGNRIRVKYTAKWGVQIAGMIFQTRSKAFSVSLSAIQKHQLLSFLMDVKSCFCQPSGRFFSFDSPGFLHLKHSFGPFLRAF
ncbi:MULTISPECIES: DUF6783 domain-containing protein [Blautia]|uniref:DUF6783 domain-containing protein n=1 Tax=Blautia TaxID=572511 RepID=UPI00299F6EC1|nr:DUF6783 domain-containing protein [Blautia schinkii]